MGKLVCEICGGSLLTNADNVAECESCGMKYAKEKVASMVKIDGAVEITKGEAEKERLLNNAETFVNLGKHVEAEDLCKKIVDEYPDDYRGWYLRFKNVVLAMDCNIELYGGHKSMLNEANINLESSLKLAPDKTSLEKEAILFWQDALQKGKQFHLPYIIVIVCVRCVGVVCTDNLKGINRNQYRIGMLRNKVPYLFAQSVRKRACGSCKVCVLGNFIREHTKSLLYSVQWIFQAKIQRCAFLCGQIPYCFAFCNADAQIKHHPRFADFRCTAEYRNTLR